MAPLPPPPRPPALPNPSVLIDELIEEFLLRLPPDDPALLARAALVSRQWHRVVTGASFRRRFRELHRSTPPLLGYFVNLADSIRFAPLSSFRPPRAHRGGVRAVSSSSHGRVLLHRLLDDDWMFAHPPPVRDVDVHLSVWHPVTDEQRDLPVVPLRPARLPCSVNWDAAVVCAVGDGCNHLRCHFMVVFVGNREDRNFSCVYSSEAGSWSDPVFASEEFEDDAFYPGNCIRIGTALYTTFGHAVFRYDLRTHQMCKIDMTPGPGFEIDCIGHWCRLVATEDGRLGFAKASNWTLRLWPREHRRLEERRVIDIRTLVPVEALYPVEDLPHPLMLPHEAIQDEPYVAAFAETGAGVILLETLVGCFTVDLKSGSSKKVAEKSSGRIVPFVSFCTPAPGAVSADDRPGAGVAISRDKVPVAISTDEGPASSSLCR